MKIQHFIGGIVMFGIWTALILLIVILCWRTPNAEPHAIVSFNDPEHLAVLQDSVVGVCDTIPPDSCATQPCPPIITCRELVCMTARWPEVVVDTVSTSYDGFFDDIFPTKTIPGRAIIFYEEVKQ